MEKAALYHRPESEYAYLYDKETMHIRLRTKRDDVSSVKLISGDPYLIHETTWYNESEKMAIIAQTEEYDYWFIEKTADFKRLQYAFELRDDCHNEEVFYGDRGIFELNDTTRMKAENYFRLPYFHDIDRVKTPEWVKETVWYQIFPERFANGDKSNDPEKVLPWGSKLPGRDDFFGGDLQGVIDNLDHLVDLGINGIYFCPIFKASSNHKYDTIDYFEIDPEFGTKELFKELVEKAHAKGIRIMLDAVFNHMGYYSKEWLDVVEKGEKSRYKDWFHINSYPVEYGKNGNFEGATTVSYDTFAFTPRMPKLNTANPEVREYLLKIATFWIEEFDIDAWRLDVANEVDHHFWKSFYEATTSIKKDFYILGEIWHSSQSWLNGDEFHAVMNYAYTETIINYFVKKEISSTKLASGLYDQLMLYREQTNQVMFNCLDSHDTTRLLTLCQGDKTLAKMTLAFTFLQQGSPCIYYGTEYAMEGENDPDCRRCMVWKEEEQDQDFYNFVKHLINVRHEEQALLSYGTLEFHILNNEQHVVGFKRVSENEELIAIFNNGVDDIEECVLTDNVILSLNARLNEDKAYIKSKGFVVYKKCYR